MVFLWGATCMVYRKTPVVKPPVKHYGLWLEWQRMLVNHEVLEHTVIHHLLSIREDVSHFSLFWFNFFLQEAFRAFWKLGLCSTPHSSHRVFHFGSSSQRMNMWAWVSALYICAPCDVVISAGSGPMGTLLFSDFFHFDSSMSLHFFPSEWKVLGFLWLGECLREKREGSQATPMFMSVCLRAARPVASPMWLQPREEPPFWWPWQTKQIEQSHFLKRWTYLEHQV